MDAIKVINFKNGQVLEISFDDINDSPRDWSNVTTMICTQNKYLLGDAKESKEFDFNSYCNWLQVERGIIEKYNPIIIMPLYAYEHGEIKLMLSPICPFDSRQVGFIFISNDSYKKNFLNHGCERTERELYKYIKDEITVYNQYLNGKIYKFILYDIPKTCAHCNHTEVSIVDCIGGFYDLKDIVDYLPCELKEEFLSKI